MTTITINKAYPFSPYWVLMINLIPHFETHRGYFLSEASLLRPHFNVTSKIQHFLRGA